MKNSVIVLLVTAVALIASAAMAEVPGLINYQGQLTDDLGDPVTTTVEMTFTIYDDSTGGNPKWTETQPTVSVAGGLFNIHLGSVNPIDDSVFNDNDRFLGIAVGADLEIQPRTRLMSVPYSHVASTVSIPWEVTDSYPDGQVRITNDDAKGNDTTAAYLATEDAGIWGYASGYRYAVYAENSTGTYGFLGSGYYGVVGGTGEGEHAGVLGGEDFGVYGQITSSGDPSAVSVKGVNQRSDNSGYIGGDSVGVFGHAETADDFAVYGRSAADDHFGYIGGPNLGVYGENGSIGTSGQLGALGGGVIGSGPTAAPNTMGYLGTGFHGVLGVVSGETCTGVEGNNSTGTKGYLATGDAGVYGEAGSGSYWAGYFDGKVQVDGDVTATTYYGDGSNLTGIAAGDDGDWTISGGDVYRASGNVGIGITSPNGPLHVESGMSIANSDHFVNREAPLVVGDADGDGSGACLLIDGNQIEQATGYKLSINAISPEDVVMVVGGGNVGIGTNTPAYKLDVNGNINVSGSYNVKKNGVNYTHPDYVFEPDYKLMSLEDLKKYVTTYKHLPNVISADEVKANDGFKLDELLIQMLEKIEEQTLYILQLEEKTKEVNELKAEVANLTSQVEKILAQLKTGNSELAVNNK
ncbi:MAG: hypothetical protein GY841_11555 [FCB group bacterium]|nr:hypothetical protein [FCB group bacterium]